MQELMIDFITTLDGYGAGEGWPGWWGLEGPEYLEWLQSEPTDAIHLMGATTYSLMHGFSGSLPEGAGEEERESFDTLGSMSKVVFSSSLEEPLEWANTTLVRSDPVDWVAAQKREGTRPMRTIGSLSLCRSLLEGGVVDRFRVVVFPVITGKTGRERIYDGYPDVTLELISSRTFDGRTQLLEYVPRVLDGPPLSAPQG